MFLYVFNRQLEQIEYIESYTSLIWERQAHKVGTFELTVSLPQDDIECAEIINLLKKDTILVKSENKNDRIVEGAIVKDISVTNEGLEILTVKGYLLDGLLLQRIILGTQLFSGTTEEIIRQVVDKNCITTAANRVIPNLILGELTNVTQRDYISRAYTNIADFSESYSKQSDLAWRVLLDLELKKLLFVVEKGNDYSIENEETYDCIFSMDYENINSQTYEEQNSNIMTTCVVAGEGEGINRKLATVNDEVIGLDRYELYVDARDLKQTDDVDGAEVTLTEEEYINLLKERGVSKLSEYKQVKAFENGINIYSNLEYEKDFDLFDKVTIENKRWGITISTRITTIREVYENNMKQVECSFGDNIPSLIESIKRVIR